MKYMIEKHNETKTGWNMMYISRVIMEWIETMMKCDEKWNERTKIGLVVIVHYSITLLFILHSPHHSIPLLFSHPFPAITFPTISAGGLGLKEDCIW